MPENNISGDPGRFRPRTVRQFLVFHIAYRLNDLQNLHRYLNACVGMPQESIIRCARKAEQEAMADGSSPADNFWQHLADGEEGA